MKLWEDNLMGFVRKEDWLKIVQATVPQKTVEINTLAFNAGYDYKGE